VCGNETGETRKADWAQEDPRLPEDTTRVSCARDESSEHRCHLGTPAGKKTATQDGRWQVIALLLALILSLFTHVLSGSVAFLLWNLGPASFEGIPEMSWFTGLASYLLVRLIASPPKIEFELGAKY
jgi:hypothetical protein